MSTSLTLHELSPPNHAGAMRTCKSSTLVESTAPQSVMMRQRARSVHGRELEAAVTMMAGRTVASCLRCRRSAVVSVVVQVQPRQQWWRRPRLRSPCSHLMAGLYNNAKNGLVAPARRRDAHADT